MVRLDSIKLTMPFDVVSSFNINDKRVISSTYTQDGSSKQNIRIEGDKSFGILIVLSRMTVGKLFCL